jgi:hypothetical protein
LLDTGSRKNRRNLGKKFREKETEIEILLYYSSEHTSVSDVKGKRSGHLRLGFNLKMEKDISIIC